jgi:uncharacterized membrane protein (DUF441 family)
VKLSKASWIALVAGILIITVATLGWNYLQQNKQKQQLEDSLLAAQGKLSAITLDDLEEQKAQLTRQVQALNTEMESIKQGLVSEEDSIDITDAVLLMASECKVKVISLSSPGPGLKDLAGLPCETMVLNIEVTGEIKDITEFVYSLSERFPTSIVESVSISGGSAPSLEEIPSDTITPQETLAPVPTYAGVLEEDAYRGSILLTIYNYKGK